MKAIDINGYITFFDNGLPRKWGDINNIRLKTEQELFDIGFRDVVYPTLTSTQKYGNSYSDLVNDVITFPVLEMTASEIEVRQERLEKTDASAQEEERRVRDGKELYKWIASKIRRAKGDSIDLAQFTTLRKNLLPIVNQLNFGAFDLVLDDLDAAIPNIPAGILTTIATEIRTKVNTYIINNPET